MSASNRNTFHSDYQHIAFDVIFLCSEKANFTEYGNLSLKIAQIQCTKV